MGGKTQEVAATKSSYYDSEEDFGFFQSRIDHHKSRIAYYESRLPSTKAKGSLLNKYLAGPAIFVDRARYYGEIADRAFMLGQHGANLGAHITKLTGNTAANERCQKAAAGFDTARDMVSFVRFVFPLESLFTGRMFWKINPDGSWKRAKVDSKGNFILDANGKLIDDPEGAYVRNDWKDIAMDIMAMAARLFSFVNRLHKMGAFDLGAHAKWVNDTIVGLWSAVLALNWVSAAIDLRNAEDAAATRKAAFNFASATLDVIALPFDIAGVGMKGHPALAITGTVICILAAAMYPLKELIYYS